jgi:hypothetical protein
MFESTDSGATWTPSNTGLPISFVGDIEFAPGAPATVYAGLVSGSVWRSTPPTPVELLSFGLE